MAAGIVVGFTALASLPTAATARSAPRQPSWIRQVLAAVPQITSAQGGEDVEVRTAGKTTSIDNSFAFDTTTRYASSDLTTGDSLDEIATVYASGDTAWLDLADPAFRSRIPAGKRFVTLPVQDLAKAGLVSTDPAAWFAPVYLLLGATHVKYEPKKGAGHHVYTFEVDLDAAERAVPDDVRTAFLHLYGQLPTGKRTHMSGTAEIDDQHHVVDFEVHLDARTGADRLRFTLDLSLDQVNVSVDQTIPPDTISVPIDSVPGLREQLQKAVGTPTANPVTGSS
ncbi:MAG TPA: hypothetical protein VFC99_16220 [Acidimicrobiia bacterium]|nr:hypothetical protein [Acidimicrobiia bacterium]